MLAWILMDRVFSLEQTDTGNVFKKREGKNAESSAKAGNAKEGVEKNL